jgi:hypothetical protein
MEQENRLMPEADCLIISDWMELIETLKANQQED